MECGIDFPEADVLVNDLTIKQCVFLTHHITASFYIYYGTQCVRMYNLPRYGLSQGRTNECSILIIGRKELDKLHHTPSITECNYNLGVSVQHPKSNHPFTKFKDVAKMLFTFRPICDYAELNLDANTIYQYIPQDQFGNRIGNLMQAMQSMFASVSPHEGHYSLSGLAHQVPPFDNSFQLYALSHFNLPEVTMSIMQNYGRFAGKKRLHHHIC